MDLTKQIIEVLNSDAKEFEGNAEVLALFADSFKDKAIELNTLFELYKVSHQRELLIDFSEKLYVGTDDIIIPEHLIDAYLKGNL